jgi:hypothetical protein
LSVPNQHAEVSLEKKFEIFGEYVRTVLNLSTGALVLSVTFLHDIVGLGGEGKSPVVVHANKLLAASWLGFLISVVGCLLYLYFLALWAEGKRDCSKQLVAGNILGLGGFLVGLIFLAIFGWLNVP